MGDYLGPYLLGPNDENQGIYTGDARLLSETIPAGTIDLILTDPPYPKEYLSLYKDLAQMAARILKLGSLCMTMAPHAHLPIILNMMSLYLQYHWTFVMWQPGNITPCLGRRLTGIGWKPVLSFSKGTYTGPYFPCDVLQSGERDKRFHAWGQHEKSSIWILQRTRAELIFDPFTGGGTVPAVCKMLGRRWLAFEINPATAERARERVQMTQMPLFTMAESEQIEMGLSL